MPKRARRFSKKKKKEEERVPDYYMKIYDKFMKID